MVVGAWGFVALFTVLGAPLSLFAFYAFPVGIPIALRLRPSAGGAMACWTIGGWLMYVLLMYWIMRIRREWAFWAFYLVLCAVLMTNLVGCDEVLKGTTRPIP